MPLCPLPLCMALPIYCILKHGITKYHLDNRERTKFDSLSRSYSSTLHLLTSDLISLKDELFQNFIFLVQIAVYTAYEDQ